MTELPDTAWPARPAWAIFELACGLVVIAAGLAGLTPFSSTPFLLGLAALFIWKRGPSWRRIGLRRTPHIWRLVAVGCVTGVVYQFVGTYLVEPALARATSAGLPDVSAFRAVTGNVRLLIFWLAISWTLAAFMEEMVFRGWLMTRLAELGGYSRRAWVLAAALSSVLFGAVHLYQGPSGVIATGLTSVVLSALYLSAGRNLWPAIMAHGMLDTVGFVMLYLGVYPGA